MAGEAFSTEVSPALGKAEWHEKVRVEAAAAYHDGQAVSVLFIDMNNFKSINDQQGHLRGDEVIKEAQDLVGLVVSQIRHEPRDGQQDIANVPFSLDTNRDEINVGHIGGDEIAILVFTDATGAKRITDRIRIAFTSYIDSPDNASLKKLGLGMAIGSATLDPRAPTIKEDSSDTELVSSLLGAADLAMYEDKWRQLPDLTDEQLNEFRDVVRRLIEVGIRPRQFLSLMNKYFEQVSEVGLVSLDESTA